LTRVRLDGAADKYIHELSGGWRKRVLAGCGAGGDPEIIFSTESFSSSIK